jgi:hypothetical protein
MIEPTDDNERTTSLGLFNTPKPIDCRRWRCRTSSTATARSHGDSSTVTRLSFYLKALLRQKHRIATVRKLGHRIRLLVREAETLGLVISDDDCAVLALIDDTDAMLDSRYIRTGTKRLATFEALRGTCQNIRDGVGTILANNDVPVRL